MKRARVWVLALAALLLVGFVAVNWRMRGEAIRLVTNPMDVRLLPRRTPIDLGLVYDDVSVTSADGLKLVGWFVPGTNRALVILQHGYRANRGEMLEEAAMLRRRGYSVLLLAMRAHDMSDGTTMTFGAKELDDLAIWLRFAGTLAEVDPDRIGLLGNSLGGTLALQFAAREPRIRAVATNSAFSSLTDTIETSIRFFTGLPPFPFGPIITFWAEREAGIEIDDVDATAVIGRISPRPVFLMQGGADVVISTDSGQRLFDAAGEPRELWFDDQVGHSRFDNARPEEYERRVVGFFDRGLAAR